MSIYRFDKAPNEIHNKVGGKGLSLIKMTNMKLPVPDGYVITYDTPLSEIEAFAPTLNTNHTYAVRSSALNEDGADASFAGQYETITDVASSDVVNAVKKVIASGDSHRVDAYTRSVASDINGGIAVVIQRFVKPELAGVLFTSDAVSGSGEEMVGNFVRGEGELLVSGASNAEEFRINALRFEYTGSHDMARHAKKLYKCARAIVKSYGCPVDIEWAVSDGKLYILQARPITTLRRVNLDTFEINGSMAGKHLLTKTNVGEIFMNPVSPATFSVLERINNMLALPAALDFINGQAFMNVSVLCSMIMSFGISREKAHSKIKDLVGTLPEGVEVPVFPFDRKTFLRNLRHILFSGNKSKLSKREKLQMVDNLADIARGLNNQIRMLESNEQLLSMFNDTLIPSLNDGLSAVLAACGTKMVPLFSVRSKITRIAGEDMANRLCGGCVGILASMKPMLLIDDIIAGRITREEYILACGQRCADEMELSKPHPYENPSFIDDLIRERTKSPVDLYAMKKQQEEEFSRAMDEFCSLYPSKRKWINKKITSFVDANEFREDIRSKGVWIMCVLREFLLAVGRVNNIGDDVFMLYLDETLALISGDTSCLSHIKDRRATYTKNLSYPPFPALIHGRFDPDKWVADPDKRHDFYTSDNTHINLSSDVKGFAGAAGTVEGTVRVITDISLIDTLEQGEILVTCATNIGWTPLFPKAAAIVTDIGAPLSHAAIVAREFGIPAVVGCGNATTVLKTGDRVLVDGAAGTVTLLDQIK